MTTFDLPAQTIVNKVIPKNAFDAFTTTRQKKKLAEVVERIKWANKLSPETINLSSKEISEFEIFEVELRKQEEVHDLLDAFDKAIPYPIIFYVFYKQQVFIRASQKHLHPTQENLSVIDWVFKSEWQPKSELSVGFDLKKNLDYVFQDICDQLSSGLSKSHSLAALVTFESELSQVQNKIERIEAAIKRTTQFNKKVELNQELQKLKKELKSIISMGKSTF